MTPRCFTQLASGAYQAPVPEKCLSWSVAQGAIKIRNGHTARNHLRVLEKDNAIGEIAEAGFARLLTEEGFVRGTTFTWNGGYNKLPDFAIGNHHIGIKCNGWKGEPHRMIHLVLAEQLALREWETTLLFGIYIKPPTNILRLLGTIDHSDFLHVATRIEKGQAWPDNPSKIAKNPCYRISAEQLTPLHDFLIQLKNEIPIGRSIAA